MSRYLQKTKLHQKLPFSSTGIVGPNPYTLDGEGRLRVSVTGSGVGNAVEIQAKLFNETSFTVLETLSGDDSIVVNVSTWDQIRINISSYGGSPTDVIVSGFYTLSIDEPVEVEGNLTVTAAESALANPSIDNIIVNSADTEQSFVFPTTTKKFSFRVRDSSARAKLSYTATESGTTYWVVNRGSVYTEQGLSLSGTLTLYFQLSHGSQVVEILYWE